MISKMRALGADAVLLVAVVAGVVGGIGGYRLGRGDGDGGAGAPPSLPNQGTLLSQPVSPNGVEFVQLRLEGASSDAFELERGEQDNEVSLRALDAGVVFRGLLVRIVHVSPDMEQREQCRRSDAMGLTLLECAGDLPGQGEPIPTQRRADVAPMKRTKP